MIRVRCGRERMEVCGHAGYAGRGEDIVCAAVSALTYALIGVLQEKGQIRDLTVRPGYICVAAAGEVTGAMELVRCGIAQLAARYPQCVKMEEENHAQSAGDYGAGEPGGRSGG